jgi:hypothetical protein
VVLLLFVIGLEMKLSRLWSLRRDLFGLGSLQILLTGLAITYYVSLGTESWRTALLIGLTLSLSSTAIVMQLLQERSEFASRHVNFRQKWRGHLWQERFHSFPMDENYLIATVRYVERNPVVANLCKFPESWPWASARAHIKGEDDALVKVEPMLA